MIRAYVALLLRRWSRRPGGVMAVTLTLGVPVLFALFGASAQAPLAIGGGPELLSTMCLLSFVAGTAPTLGALVASAIHDELGSGRAGLLRVGGLDGRRAVASYLLFSALLVTPFCLLTHVVFLWMGAPLHLPTGYWLRSFALYGLYLAAVGPIATAASVMLPRAPATLAAMLGGSFLGVALIREVDDHRLWFAFREDLSAALVLVAILHVLAIVVLSPGWRRLGGRAPA